MTESSRPVGTGPGVITPDGCAVDFYARMTAMGEPEIVHGAIPPRSSVLELGCGTGRITRPLVALGHPVEWHEYPMAHSVCPEEVVDLNRWLLRVLA